MSKYSFTDSCDKIGGIADDYEESCRKMVIAGMEWMDNHPDALPNCIQYKNIFGLSESINKEAKDLENHMNNSIVNFGYGDASGAMIQMSVNHVLYAAKNGWKKYIQQLEKRKVKK